MPYMHTDQNAKKKVGHGNFVGMGLSLDWGFVVKKSANNYRVQKLTDMDGSQVYLLATNHFCG